MGREVRRVPSDWEHPKKDDDNYVPLYDQYAEALDDFAKAIERDGLANAIEYHCGGPMTDDYMPSWPDARRTHFQMYEDTTEGTPISPVMETPEELARWLADNNASAFGSYTATYEQWLSMIDAGWASSAVATVKADGTAKWESGVAANLSKAGN